MNDLYHATRIYLLANEPDECHNRRSIRDSMNLNAKLFRKHFNIPKRNIYQEVSK